MSTTLRASASGLPRRGSSTARSKSPSMPSMSKSDSSRRRCLNSDVLSRSLSTRFHSVENGTSKRRRRILRI